MRKELEKVKKQLCMTRYAVKELELLENELRELETESYIMGQQLSVTPTRTKTTDKVANRAMNKILLEKQIELSIQKIYEEREKAERLIDLVEDAEKRLILRLCCINGMRIESAALEMNMCNRTVLRKEIQGLEEIYKKLNEENLC